LTYKVLFHKDFFLLGFKFRKFIWNFKHDFIYQFPILCQIISKCHLTSQL
jgi:hypothetical protein